MAAIRPLAPELAELAKVECLEVNAEIPKAIAELRKWIEEKPELKARTDDQFLVAFLRHCKYDLKTAQERLYFFYEYKTTSGLQQSHLIDTKLLEICDSGIFTTLTKPIGVAGPRIHITRMGYIDTKKFNVRDCFRYHMFRSEYEINKDDNWNIAGVIEIVDFTKMPYAILRQFEPNLFRKMSALLEHGLPTNLKATHVVHASLDVQVVLGIVKTIMKEKELLQIHTSLESLQNAIGKEYLPVEYGGTNGSMDDAIVKFKTDLLEMEQYFVDNENYGVDEKRLTITSTPASSASASPTAAHTAKVDNTLTDTPTVNVVGSFRKLDID